MEEQESDSLPIKNDPIGIENDPAVVDTQTVTSLVQHTTDGKKIICLFCPSATIMNWKSSLMLSDTNVESLEPIQPDTIDALLGIPSS